MIEKESANHLAQQILADHTSFRWEGGQDWVGCNQDDLRVLVGIIASSIGITPPQAERISLVFSDHLPAENSDNGGHTSLACCVGIYNGQTTRFLGCYVVINRSLELARYCLKRNRKTNRNQKKLQSLGVYGSSPDTEPIYCEFENALEAVIWLIAEELKHAQIYLLAQTNNRYKSWSRRHLEIMKSKGIKTGNLYTTDLSEIATCRTVLRILAMLSNEERRQYFRDLYGKSLVTGQIVIHVLYEPALIKTGYSPIRAALSRLSTSASNLLK